MNVRIEHHVQSADLVNEPEEIFQVNILQIHRNGFACIFRASDGALLSGLSLLLCCQIHCRSDRWRAALGLLSRVHAHRQQFRRGFVREFCSRILSAIRRSVRDCSLLCLVRRLNEDVLIGGSRCFGRRRNFRLHGRRGIARNRARRNNGLRVSAGMQAEHKFTGRSGRQFVGASLFKINDDASSWMRLSIHADAHALDSLRANRNGLLPGCHDRLRQIDHYAGG